MKAILAGAGYIFTILLDRKSALNCYTEAEFEEQCIDVPEHLVKSSTKVYKDMKKTSNDIRKYFNERGIKWE